jgi:hypothetical protein
LSSNSNSNNNQSRTIEILNAIEISGVRSGTQVRARYAQVRAGART